MARAASPNWASIVKQGAAAGVVGAVTIELYLYLTTILPAHQSLLEAWRWIASAALGRAALTTPNDAWLGLLFHVCVSVGWAGGYAYFAQSRPFVNARWFVSGVGYGVVVYVFMQVLLLGVGELVPPPTPLDLLNALAAHTLFFGVPVAFVVARMDNA